MAIAVKFRGAELGWLPVLVEAIHEQDVAASRVSPYEFGSIITDDLEAITLGRHQELVANGNDLGIDFDRGDQAIGQILIAIFCQRPSAEPDDLDGPRRGIEQEETHHLARIVKHQPVRVVDTHRALHKGPIGQETSYIAELEDERNVKSALLHQMRIVTVRAISFEMTMIAVDVVEVIEKMIELGPRLTFAMQVRSCFGSASHVALDFQAFCDPIGHRHDVCFADRAPVPLQW